MTNIIITWLYLLKENHEILKMDMDESLNNDLLATFSKYVVENAWWVTSIQDYSHLTRDSLDDDWIDEFYRLESEVPHFWEIKTNILQWTTQKITREKFDNLKDEKIVSWVVHICIHEWHDIKNCFLFQHFYYQNMHVGVDKWATRLSFSLTDSSTIFSSYQNNRLLTMKKHISVIYLDDGKIYSLNRKQFNNIFNYVEEIRQKIPEIFDRNYLQSGFFECSQDEHDNIMSLVDNNHRVAKKIYHIFTEEIIDSFDVIVFKDYLDSEQIANINFDSNNKVIVKQQWFEDLLDAILGKYFTSPITNQKYIAKTRKKR